VLVAHAYFHHTHLQMSHELPSLSGNADSKFYLAYLAQFDTPKAKIFHLKHLLAELGMTGRYSGQKAASIKEERELQADLEAVQAGAKQWGKDSDEDNHDGGGLRPRRQLAKGLEGLDFLNDDDGHETD